MTNITIKAVGMELTPAIKAYAEEKVGSVDKYVNPDDTSARADIEVGQTTSRHHSGPIFRTEINFHMAGKEIRVESEQEDLYAAIDTAKDELLDELREWKQKKKSDVRRGGRLFKSILHRLGWGTDDEH